uniref:Uncharacterized protein n=1 Tax=Arundo donax TaxID=35708 RepID=A0A0A9GCY1_ARUDO
MMLTINKTRQQTKQPTLYIFPTYYLKSYKDLFQHFLYSYFHGHVFVVTMHWVRQVAHHQNLDLHQSISS